jgi:hypothetical protein
VAARAAAVANHRTPWFALRLSLQQFLTHGMAAGQRDGEVEVCGHDALGTLK